MRGTPDMSKTLFDRILEMDNLESAFKQTQKGKGKYDADSMKFYSNLTYNLHELQERLRNGSYEFSDYINFKVYEPKEREINAPHFEDKLVQLAINNIIKDLIQPKFIYDSYACIEGKGTHKCVERISYFLRKASWQYGNTATIIKIDIKKFFYSINRDILKAHLPKIIKCKRTLNLIFKIIDSADMIDLVGLPLGNTLSQICANIYMNILDQYCKRVLRIKYYVRYADDIVIVVENIEKAKEVLDKIINFIETVLDLKTNINKTKIFPLEQGVNTVGFKIYKTHRLLRSDSKKKIKRRIKAMPHLINEGRLTIAKAEQMLNSWKGHSDYGCNFNFLNRLIVRNTFIYISENGTLKINENRLKGDECYAL